jgi:hypothetical protein
MVNPNHHKMVNPNPKSMPKNTQKPKSTTVNSNFKKQEKKLGLLHHTQTHTTKKQCEVF